jgi:hypothetical protein
VRVLALTIAGRQSASAGAEDGAARRHRAPRLTEPWFC